MASLFDSGIIPIVNAHIQKLANETRDYGEYWSASSAGKCYRLNMFERLKIPPVKDDPRKQRIFSAGHVFHEWIQEITKDAGLSIAQEIELQDEELMIRGHVDDLVLITEGKDWEKEQAGRDMPPGYPGWPKTERRLILYDYKTAHGKWFEYAKKKPVSYYNKMQVGTYMYMLRTGGVEANVGFVPEVQKISEARVLKISKDDLRLFEYQIMWSEELEKEVLEYWQRLNKAWKTYQKTGELPPCTCDKHENGFLAREAYNPYFYEGKPCSEVWLLKKLKEKEDEKAEVLH